MSSSTVARQGPLLRELWEGPSDDKKNVVQYVVQMRERLEEMTSLAQVNMQKAQKSKKTWYDRRTRERLINPGQKILLLLPSQDSKLLDVRTLMKCRGRPEVIRSDIRSCQTK